MHTMDENMIRAIENFMDEEWYESDLIIAWNTRCQKLGYDEYMIFQMPEFDEFFCGCKPLEILDKVDDGFNPNDEYFIYNGHTGRYKSLDSFDGEDSPFDKSELIEFIVEYEGFGFPAYITTIDNSNLREAFIEEYFFDDDVEADDILSGIEDEEDINFFTEDWDALADRIRPFLKSEIEKEG